MEINSSSSITNTLHPNYVRWKRGRDLSVERGKFVESILNQSIKTENYNILDLGSGEGGTSFVLSKTNYVVSSDISLTRLQRQSANYNNPGYPRVNCSGNYLPLKNGSVDIIILQDVFEHIDDQNLLINEMVRVLNPNGSIFLSTPNRLSLFNIISDPHWGVPIVALLNRNNIRKYFLRYFRKSELNRTDAAELSSLKSIIKLFEKDFSIKLFTKFAATELLNGNRGIVWSNFHLKLTRFLKITGLSKIILLIINDKPGFINKYITPTFYMLLQKH